MLKIAITVVGNDGDEKSDTIEVEKGKTLKHAIAEAEQKGFDFSGRGVFQLNGGIVRKAKVSDMLNGRLTRDVVVRYIRQDARCEDQIDLNSLR